MHAAVDSTINQISSSCAEWWSSFVCSLRFGMFHKGFCLGLSLFYLWPNLVNSIDFPEYIRQFYEQVVVLQHTFENYAFGTSEIDTPIEDQKLDGRFVERIRGSSRESLIGVVKNARARAGPAPRGSRKPPGPLQRPRCLGNQELACIFTC